MSIIGTIGTAGGSARFSKKCIRKKEGNGKLGELVVYDSADKLCHNAF